VTGCQSDADCPAGLVCEFTFAEPMGDLRCGEGQTDNYCGVPTGGQCVEPQPDRCAGLDEWSCINTPTCEPLYEYAACDCIDCFCAEMMTFVGCVERPVDPCMGAWLDENGLCRGPADGTLPQECCGGFECYDDSQCPEGFVCEFPMYDCAEGELDCGMLPGGGVCVPAVTGCAALDEAQCLQDPSCAPVYVEEFCPMNCVAGDANCACEPVFGGCVDANACFGAWLDQNGLCRAADDGVLPAECCGLAGCTSDVDCPNGYCEFFATCAGLDCPPPPAAQCVYQNCDDGSQPVCDVAMLPECPAGQTLAVRDGCFACVDARTCEPVLYDCDGSDGCALPPQE